MRDARHQRVDVAVESVELRHLAADPCARQPFGGAGQVLEAMRQKARVAVAHHLAEIGDLADFPQQANRAGMDGEAHHLSVARQQLQCPLVVGIARLYQAGRRRPLVETAQ